MSTRSMIAEKLDDGSFKGTSIHWDGYFGYVGMILNKYYQDPKKVDKLISLGQISGLGKDIEPSPLIKKYSFDYCQNKNFQKLPEKKQIEVENKINGNDVTTAYHRDRGEDWSYTKPCTWKNAKEFKADVTSSGKHGYIDPIFIEYMYLYEHNQWYVIMSDDFGITLKKPLTIPQAINKLKSKKYQDKIKFKRELPTLRKKVINHLKQSINMVKLDEEKAKQGFVSLYTTKALNELMGEEYDYIIEHSSIGNYSDNRMEEATENFCIGNFYGLFGALNRTTMIEALNHAIKEIADKNNVFSD